MKDSLDSLKKNASKITKLFTKYSFIIFLLIFAGMAGFLVTRIGNLSRLEPTQIELDTKLQDIKKQTKADADAIAKLEELEESDISIESLFDNGRTNPFED